VGGKLNGVISGKSLGSWEGIALEVFADVTPGDFVAGLAVPT